MAMYFHTFSVFFFSAIHISLGTILFLWYLILNSFTKIILYIIHFFALHSFLLMRSVGVKFYHHFFFNMRSLEFWSSSHSPYYNLIFHIYTSCSCANSHFVIFLMKIFHCHMEDMPSSKLSCLRFNVIFV